MEGAIRALESEEITLGLDGRLLRARAPHEGALPAAAPRPVAEGGAAVGRPRRMAGPGPGDLRARRRAAPASMDLGLAGRAAAVAASSRGWAARRRARWPRRARAWRCAAATGRGSTEAAEAIARETGARTLRGGGGRGLGGRLPAVRRRRRPRSSAGSTSWSPTPAGRGPGGFEGVVRRGLGSGLPGDPGQRRPPRAGGGAAHARQPLGAHREHRVALRQAADRRPRAVQRVPARRSRAWPRRWPTSWARTASWSTRCAPGYTRTDRLAGAGAGASAQGGHDAGAGAGRPGRGRPAGAGRRRRRSSRRWPRSSAPSARPS